jgi:alpha-amylase
MGFDALWITPVVKQVNWRDRWNGTSYHGYWAADFFAIDDHLGTEEDLISLKHACKERGMLLMLDIVANHVGPIHDIAQVLQLGAHINSPSGQQFHQLRRSANETFEQYIDHPTTMQDAGACWPWYDFNLDCNLTVIQDGWFGDLADLRQEDPATASYLLHWIAHMRKKYGIDGFRLDTALYLPKLFLSKFQQAAGVYMIGEVVTYNMSVHSSFMPPLTGLLNFPVTEQLKHIFGSNGSFMDLSNLLEQQMQAGYPDLNLLGNFLDNHDGERFVHNQSGDLGRLRNGLAWTMLYQGIPIIYYGTEQLQVSNQQDSRTSMWPHYGTTEVSMFLARLNQLRQNYGFASGGSDATVPAVTVSVSQNSFSFVRGQLLIVVTNTGSGGRLLRHCVPLRMLPTSWAGVCSSKSFHLVLGNASFECFQQEVCMDMDGQQPCVFAASSAIV